MFVISHSLLTVLIIFGVIYLIYVMLIAFSLFVFMLMLFNFNIDEIM